MLMGPVVASGQVVINEVLAYNRNTAVGGDYCPDFVELRNNGSSAVNLSGYNLSDDPLAPTKYTFPAGTSIAGGSYLLVFCDSDTSRAGIHTSFGLNSEGDQIRLLNGATLVDSLIFGPQAPDVSLGRVLDGTGAWLANSPSPGNPNTAKTLGAVGNLRVNEWMAEPAYGEDWFEIYNADSNPVALAGLYLSDTTTTPKLTQIAALSFITGKGCTRFWADGLTTGGSHCAFKLKGTGESVVLTASNGTTALDTIDFSTQAVDVSQGRLPDGGTTKVAFTAQSVSPGYANWVPAAVCIHEVLANAASPFEDAIELYNPTAGVVDIGGWWLSDDVFNCQKYQIPAGTSMPAGGYKVIYANLMEHGAQPFVLSALGDEVILSAVDGAGALTGAASFVRFGASAENVSFGRVAATGLNASSGGAEFWPQAAHTFGQDNPASVAVFRTGSGASNALPRIGPVVINEIMYHPVDSAGAVDNTRDEFVEISNLAGSAQNISGWRLKGDSEFIFPTGTSLSANGSLLVVSFDPADTVTLTAFRSTYGLPATVPVLGPYSQKLSNGPGSVEIAYPATVVSTATFINVDKVEYRDLAPWPSATDSGVDGGGQSLQRRSNSRIGNTAANWAAATPTPGAVNMGVLLVHLTWDYVPSNVHANQPFAVRLSVRDLDGRVVSALNGSVTATATPPTLTSATLALAQGEFIGYVAISQAGSATLTANDGYGHSVASGVITVLAGTDSDGDGMPDAWETANGLSVGTNDSALDKDGDGMPNAAEWMAGTNPQSASSRLAITSSILGLANSTFTIGFPGVAGKLYRVCTSPDLKAWVPVPPLILPASTAPQTVTLPVSGSHEFLRVEIVPSS